MLLLQRFAQVPRRELRFAEQRLDFLIRYELVRSVAEMTGEDMPTCSR
jgi:hypothetical protein